METTKFIFVSILLLCSVISIDLIAQKSAEINYESLYNQLEDWELQKTSAKVFNYTMERDVGNFYFKTGDIYLCQPIFGKEYAFLFIGIGEFSFTPPTRVEKEQLERFFETQELKKVFKTLIVFVGDSTVKQLKKDFKFYPNNQTDIYNSEIEDWLEYVTEEDNKYIRSNFVKTILEGKENNLFFAHIVEDGEDPVAFEVDPYDVEEISFLKSHDQHEYFEIINQFHRQEDYNSLMSLSDENKNRIDVTNYKINGTIDDGLDFSCETKMTFIAKEYNQKWLRIRLYHKLEIDSIFWANGDTVEYYKYEENSNLWIHCTNPLMLDSTYQLKIYYHGDLIDRASINWFYIESSISWYPKQNGKDKAIFDITFHTPERYTFVSVGEQKYYTEDDDVTHSQWLTERPIRNASFNIGVFRKYEIADERIPPATVYISEEGHHELGLMLGQDGILSGSNMEKQVAADIANSMAFYQDIFGPCPAKKLYATEIPYYHGASFPGLIHLSWTTFQQTDQWGFDEFFRGHEVAHQWFPSGVDYKTYHDRWLSEGFASYLGIWYMQSILKDNEKFFDLLNRWKTDIFENRKFLFGSGNDAGPVSLGHRNFTSETKEDYKVIVYQKGAWVLHMLRNIMVDLRSMKEDRFKNMLKDFYTSYLYKSASTVDFQRVVEKHLNKDMDWFFDQWIYGTEIPEYNFSWTSSPIKNGRYQIQCKIYQENVENDFQMYVPIQISFGDKGVARLRILVSGNKFDYTLPTMPYEPKEVTFNYLESVLCKVND